MEEIQRKSIDLLCRTCMTSESNCEDAKTNIMISIYDTIGGLDCPNEVFSEDLKIIILDLIKRTCPQLEIEYNDNLPAFICKICEQKLLELYEFQQNALRVENKLREIIACDYTDPLIENTMRISADPKLVKIEIMEPSVEFKNDENEIKSFTSDAEWQNEDEDATMEFGEVCSRTIKSKNNSISKVKDLPFDDCYSKLSSSKSLKRHKLIHEKQYDEEPERGVKNKDNMDSAESKLKTENNQCEVSKEIELRIQEKAHSNEQLKCRKIDKSDLKETVDIAKPFACDVCGKKLSHYRNLKRHKLIHTRTVEDGAKSYSKTANAVGSIINNEKVDSVAIEPSSKGNQCEFSKEEFRIQEHKNLLPSVHSGKDLISQGIDKSNLQETAATENPFACDICGNTLSCQRSLKRHKRIHTRASDGGDKSDLKRAFVADKDKSFACNECGKALTLEKNLKRHMKLVHTNVKQKNKVTKTTHECEYCQKVFEKPYKLKEHKRTHTGETPYLCSECGRSFKLYGYLKQHLLRHGKEKPYECPDCPRRFPCMSDLCSHKTIHTQIKSHVCDICGRGFIKPFQLKKHKMYHNGERPHSCKFCEKRFVKAEQCRRHMRTHTGEKPYKCKFCERAFAQSNDLMKHMRIHLGDNVYRCNLCPSRFPLYSELRSHFITHKNDDDETRANNLKALQEDEVRIDKKFGLVSSPL